MSPKILILVFAQLFVVCLGDINIFVGGLTAPTQSQTTPELHTKVKLSGYEYSNETGHWYKFYASPLMNWADARKACESDGARLAVPNSDAEAKVIMGLHAKYLNAEITNTEEPYHVMLGIFWEDGAWRTVDGELHNLSGYVRWMKGYPVHGYLPFAVMNRGGDLMITHSTLNPFVCEKEHALAEITINYH